ncbi:VOC family protein [Mumia sp.]|uniref:VOC family protein n=1 Tax=Mumia sp. TaxID=1965300 RepID=UPI00261393D9|nr:VOC family protein [Mumia sp.]MDD9350393.1 VOC family protein [Mumia sp.]
MDVLLLTTDLQASRDFYARRIGLEIVREKDDAVWFACGGGCRLAVGKSTTGTADEQDRATWRVDDVAAEVAQLRARGVDILDIDEPEMGIKTVDGIADVGHAYAAWFVDPGENSLSILQFK